MTRRERSQLRGAGNPYKDPFTKQVLRSSRGSTGPADDGYGSATEQRVKVPQTQSQLVLPAIDQRRHQTLEASTEREGLGGGTGAQSLQSIGGYQDGLFNPSQQQSAAKLQR